MYVFAMSGSPLNPLITIHEGINALILEVGRGLLANGRESPPGIAIFKQETRAQTVCGNLRKS